MRPTDPILFLLFVACSTEAPYREIPWPEQDQDGEPPLGWTVDMPSAKDGFTLLSANVGNIDINRCGSVLFKLCTVETEREIAARIGRLDPDVVLLQEVLPQKACEGAGEIDARHVCHPSNASPLPQIERLLGDDYATACDPIRGYECIGVHRRIGAITGDPIVTTDVEGCDSGFTLTSVPAVIGDQELLLTSAHPKSGFDQQSARCREAQLTQVFTEGGPQIIGGDFNLDPYRTSTTSPDIALWHEWVSPKLDDRPFAYHSGLTEHDPPYWTVMLIEKTLDHVLSRGFIGRCTTLGGPAGSPPLDSQVGEDGFQYLDHYAELCTLSARR